MGRPSSSKRRRSSTTRRARPTRIQKQSTAEAGPSQSEQSEWTTQPQKPSTKPVEKSKKDEKEETETETEKKGLASASNCPIDPSPKTTSHGKKEAASSPSKRSRRSRSQSSSESSSAASSSASSGGESDDSSSDSDDSSGSETDEPGDVKAEYLNAAGTHFRVHVAKLNPEFTCTICNGYFREASTLIECQHTFCKSCILKCLSQGVATCPEKTCGVALGPRPLSKLRPDQKLQAILNLIFPSLVAEDVRNEKEFALSRRQQLADTTGSQPSGVPAKNPALSPTGPWQSKTWRSRQSPQSSTDSSASNSKETNATWNSASELRSPSSSTVGGPSTQAASVTAARPPSSASGSSSSFPSAANGATAKNQSQVPVQRRKATKVRDAILQDQISFELVPDSTCAPPVQYPRLKSPFLLTSNQLRIGKIKKHLAKQLGIPKPDQIELCCKGDILGSDLTLNYVKVSRWHDDQKRMVLHYRKKTSMY